VRDKEILYMGGGWSTDNLPSLTGKVALVTGANSGLGFFTALELGKKGAHVIVASRDASRGNAAVQELRQALVKGTGQQTNLLQPKGSFELQVVDLSDLTSITQMAARFLESNRPLDILVNNAGIMALPNFTASKGTSIELQMATNHVGHFALTGLLLPALRRSNEAARVVNVSSMAAERGSHELVLATLRKEIHAGNYNAMSSYSASKLANLMFSEAMYSRYPGIVTVSSHPGVSGTNLGQNMTCGCCFTFSRYLCPCFVSGADDGALSQIRAAGSTDVRPREYYGPKRHSAGPPDRVTAPPSFERSKGHLDEFWRLSVAASGVNW